MSLESTHWFLQDWHDGCCGLNLRWSLQTFALNYQSLACGTNLKVLEPSADRTWLAGVD